MLFFFIKKWLLSGYCFFIRVLIIDFDCQLEDREQMSVSI